LLGNPEGINMAIQTAALNSLTQPIGTVYLNEPMNSIPQEDESQTEPLEPAGSDEPTSATLTDEEKTYKKRYDDLKTHYDRTKASFESQLSELKTQVSELTTKAIEKVAAPEMPKTPDEFKAFQEKYPDLAANIMTAAMMAAAKSSSVVEQKLKQIEEKQNAYSAEKGVTELKKYHPDFETIKDDPRFIEWFNMQEVEVKNLIRSANPKVIARGLDLYKEYAGIKTPAIKAIDKKDATREVKTPTNRVQIGEGQKRTYTNAEIHRMSEKEFEKLAPDIIAAQYEGRIVG
jgi:hypothetical protein